MTDTLTHAATQELQRSRCVLLPTYKRDGSPVATPVWPFEFDGRLMASTRDKAWKLKRIQNDPHVLVARCTQRGKQTGPSYEARARVLDSSQVGQALRAKRRRWWIQRLTEPLDRGTEQVPAGREEAPPVPRRLDLHLPGGGCAFVSRLIRRSPGRPSASTTVLGCASRTTRMPSAFCMSALLSRTPLLTGTDGGAATLSWPCGAWWCAAHPVADAA